LKALLSRAPGGPETLELAELPDPVVGPGQLLVTVKACAINYPDVLIIEDKYQFRPERPFAPGGEIAGVIEALGEGVTGWSVGDRIIAMLGHGGLSEKVLIAATMAVPLLESRSFEDGSALILTYGTTIHALVDRAKLRAGETLLVLGAAGGVGLAAVELGKAYGARVVAAVSSEEKAEAAKAAGADEAIVYPRGPFDKDGAKALAQQFKAAVGPSGADVVYDPVGGDVFWGAFAARDPKANAAHIRTLFRLWDEGKIAPRVSRTWPLAQGGEAIAHMAARQAVGKLVVTMG